MSGTLRSVIPISGGGGLESVIAGVNISVDNTDPENPIINSLSDRYKTTSTTSNTIVSAGTLTFTVDAGLSYIPLQEVLIVYDASNHMHGTVSSYSGTTLIVDISHKTGSGTYSAWTINLDGTPVDALTGSGTTNEISYFTGSQTLSSLSTDNIDITNRTMGDTTGVTTLDYEQHILYDTASDVAIDFSSPARLNVNSKNIVNLADPTNPQDAATKAYVDSSGGGGVSEDLAIAYSVSL